VDVIDAETRLVQRVEKVRLRMLGTAVDEGAATVLDHQVAGVETGALKAGVDDMNGVFVVHGESLTLDPPPALPGPAGLGNLAGVPPSRRARAPAACLDIHRLMPSFNASRRR